MTGGYFADADRIGDRAQDFDGHAQQARKVAESLKSVLDSGGNAWGDDAVGQSFDAAHTAPAARALELVGGLGDELDAIGAKFTAAAKTYRATDTAGAEDIGAAGRELGEA